MRHNDRVAKFIMTQWRIIQIIDIKNAGKPGINSLKNIFLYPQ